MFLKFIIVNICKSFYLNKDKKKLNVVIYKCQITSIIPLKG